ncbi:MAG: damage-control phosphatase ARMT1 family protein [Planctomycetota bacterium]|jgi:uncharacterized protein with ATP-grasp and redox domains
MKAPPDCIPYALNQVLATARLVTEDEWIHRKVLMRVLADMAEEKDLEKTASEIIFGSLQTAYKALGVKDPYENEKARINKAVGALISDFSKKVAESSDKITEALKFAMAGTTIDADVNNRLAAEEMVNKVLDKSFTIDESDDLLKQLKRAEKVVYILNNAGEALCDKLFIEEIARKAEVTVVVRSSPILNDVTLEDAEKVGFDDILNTTLLNPGFPMLGVLLEKSSSELQQSLKDADLIISKGQANYETLYSEELNIFFLFCARSTAICSRLGVEEGSQVLVRQGAKAKTGSTTAISSRKKVKA